MNAIGAVLIVTVWLLLHAYVDCKGKGPVHMWAADHDIVFVADSSLPGVVVVSLSRGVALERLNFLEVGEDRAVGIASCLDCSFALFTAGKDRIFRINFNSGNTVAEILELFEPRFFDDVSVELLDLNSTGIANGIDVRMLVVQNDGSRAYVASSLDNTVYKVNLFKSPVRLQRLFTPRGGMPFGANFDMKDDDILVTMHHNFIYRLSTKGEVRARYDLVEAMGCPNAELEPNLRQTVEDPLFPDQAILVLGSQPRTYDAAVWRLNYVTGECDIIAGRTGVNSGWVDGVGTDIRFSRPHGMCLLPRVREDDPWILAVTDIDNRAIRLLDLTTLRSTTVMYDRDRRVELELPPLALVSNRSCFDVTGLGETGLVTSITSGRFALAERPGQDALKLKFARAAEYCESRGMRLCEASELRESGIASDMVAWTQGECASCWQRGIRKKCAPEIISFRSEGVHSTKGFEHSWNDGMAYEIGADLDGGPATVCHANNATQSFRAAAPCCVDC